MSRHSLRTALTASTGLVLFYVVVVWVGSGSFTHVVDQAEQDWYFLAAIITGFGTQVGLVSELRRRHRLRNTDAAAGLGGMGASSAGMVACCAHHIFDLAPFIGATGAATFLTNYRVPFMVIGIGVNAIGIGVAARRLGHTPPPPRKTITWVHA